MVFYPVIGWLLVFVGVIASIGLFIWKRKWAPIAYVISIALYVFAISFVIDVFDLARGIILLLLVLSALLMMGIGYYLK